LVFVVSSNISSSNVLLQPVLLQTFGQAWVEGERMEGSNQLACDFLPKSSDGSTQKANGLRRTCIGTLPNTLIFHLKRFGLDYQTFESYKINSYCEFPELLDMKKYTANYLVQQDHMAAEGGGEGGEEGGAEKATDDEQVKDEEDCTYRLRGVVIHLGVAGGGHYWSLARNDQNQWMKFNDIEVTSFDAKHNLATEAFGGTLGAW
jgi:ubiquitin carboxyl-terminal hydrolase 9/24